MTFKKVHCYYTEQDIIINTDNISYIEPDIFTYKLHMSCGTVMLLDKYDYQKLVKFIRRERQ